MRGSRWFSSIVLVVLLAINGISFVFLKEQPLGQPKFLLAMSTVILLTLSVAIFQNRGRLKSRKNKSAKNRTQA